MELSLVIVPAFGGNSVQAVCHVSWEPRHCHVCCTGLAPAHTFYQTLHLQTGRQVRNYRKDGNMHLAGYLLMVCLKRNRKHIIYFGDINVLMFMVWPILLNKFPFWFFCTVLSGWNFCFYCPKLTGKLGTGTIPKLSSVGVWCGPCIIIPAQSLPSPQLSLSVVNVLEPFSDSYTSSVRGE